MPELPEVEVMSRRLKKYEGRRISSCDFSGMHESKRPAEPTAKTLVDSTILSVWRYGKVLVFQTSHGMLVCHNSMSGYWDSDDEPWTFDYVEGKREAADDDVRARIFLHPIVDGAFPTCLRFHDSRKFGSIAYTAVHLEYPRWPRGGDVMILSAKNLRTYLEVNRELEITCHPRRRRTVKEALVDQDVIAGIGNIYAAEILWEAQILPTNLWRTVSLAEIDLIVSKTKEVMKRALEHELRYDEYLKCYRREKCVRCGDKISTVEIAGRTTYYCGGCQS